MGNGPRLRSPVLVPAVKVGAKRQSRARGAQEPRADCPTNCAAKKGTDGRYRRREEYNDTCGFLVDLPGGDRPPPSGSPSVRIATSVDMQVPRGCRRPCAEARRALVTVRARRYARPTSWSGPARAPPTRRWGRHQEREDASSSACSVQRAPRQDLTSNSPQARRRFSSKARQRGLVARHPETARLDDRMHTPMPALCRRPPRGIGTRILRHLLDDQMKLNRRPQGRASSAKHAQPNTEERVRRFTLSL